MASRSAGDAAEPRLVITIDSRGRGRSDYDPNPDNYSFPVELADVLAVLTALDIGRAILLGTSRGGILAMLLGAARPGALAGVILNDIGPVIDAKGLVRIKGYVGKMPTPRSFAEGAEILRRLGDAQFPAMTPEQWLAQAQAHLDADRQGACPRLRSGDLEDARSGRRRAPGCRRCGARSIRSRAFR